MISHRKTKKNMNHKKICNCFCFIIDKMYFLKNLE